MFGGRFQLNDHKSDERVVDKCLLLILRARLPRMHRGDASIYQQILKKEPNDDLEQYFPNMRKIIQSKLS